VPDLCSTPRQGLSIQSEAPLRRATEADARQCDQTRPVCQRCLKANRPCPGYGQDRKFQDEGPRLRQHFQKRAEKRVQGDESRDSSESWTADASFVESSYSSSALALKTRDQPGVMSVFENPGAVDLELTWVESDQAASGWETRPSDPFDVADGSHLLDGLFPSPYVEILSPILQQNQLLDSFISSLNPAFQVDVSPALRNHTRWLAYLPSLSGTNSLLDSSIRACTVAHLGRLYASERLLQDSRSHYGRALRSLNRDLQDMVKGTSGETLSATILLSFYEMLATDMDQTWVRHAGGAGTLMKLRGVGKHRSGFDREIFRAYRHALVIQAFEMGQPCFLEAPEWVELSRQIHEDIRKSGMVGEKMELFDIAEEYYIEMVPLPHLIWDIRHIPQLACAAGKDHATVAQEMFQRAVGHRTRMKSVYARFRDACKRLGHAPVSRLRNDAIFPVRYEFNNVFVGSSIVGYWTILMMLNAVLRELDKDVDRKALYRMEAIEAARDCCRSVDFMMRSSFLGPFFITFALRVSLIWIEDQEQRTWIITRLLEVGNTKLGMAKQLPEAMPETFIGYIRGATQEIEKPEDGDPRSLLPRDLPPDA